MSIDAMKQALEALEAIADEVFSPYDNQLGSAILALRLAIEQAERQEPTAAMIQALTEQYDADRAIGIGFNPQTLCRAVMDARE